MEVALIFVDVLQGIFGIFVHRTEILTQQEVAVVKVLHYKHHSKKKRKQKEKKKAVGITLTSCETFQGQKRVDWIMPPVGLVRGVRHHTV